VLTIAHEEFVSPRAVIYAPPLAALVKAEGYTHVLGTSSTFSRDLMPHLAALLDAPCVSDVMAFLDARTFKRPVYAGNAIITSRVADGSPVIVATVRSASFEATGEQSPAPVDAASVLFELPTHTEVVGISASAAERADLQSAARVISGGRALGSAENFQLLYRLADKLGAAVGASRAAVDASYAPSDLQVGQTGKIIAPELYIAVGISGAIQHVTGIRDARTIVAINKDAEAPIFQVADIGLVGDLFELLPKMEELLA
jgi:electron transfer flavoprotein alpha subunit